MVCKKFNATLNKLRKRFSKIKSSMFKTYSDDSYVNTEVVYNVKENLIILISFSCDYFEDVVEFLVSCVYSNIAVKYSNSSYEESLNDNTIIHNKYYILIGGNTDKYCKLFKNINNLNNSILEAISTDIVNCRSSSDFKEISDILSASSFKYNAVKPKYDEVVNISDKNNYSYDDVKHIMSKLPESFTGQDILKFINCYINIHSNNIISHITAYEMLNMAYNENDHAYKDMVKIFKNLFKEITNNPTENILKNFVGPQYLVCNDDTLPGDISDESLDEIFRQSYYRFNAISSNNVNYEDIDEIIDPNDENENIRQADIINNAEEDY